MSHQPSSYHQFEQETVNLMQGTKEIVLAAEGILSYYPQVQVWMNPLSDPMKILGRYPKEDRMADQFP